MEGEAPPRRGFVVFAARAFPRTLQHMARLALAVGVAALLVSVVAVVDHRHKRAVEFAAQEDAWFCAHGRPAECRDFDEARYEARWERRELTYKVGFFALGASAVGLAAVGLQRQRRERRARAGPPGKGATLPVGAPRDQPPGSSAL
jgi:hypothetical protein